MYDDASVAKRKLDGWNAEKALASAGMTDAAHRVSVRSRTIERARSDGSDPTHGLLVW
jgi:hypothetical protein